jgi:hypothetical protein
MFFKFLSFSNLTLLVALALSTVAEFYSIMGLTAIFAGAVVPVIIMGVTLGVAKITTTVWLRKYWHRAGWVIKLYLVPAVFALAMLTSMGIFGFLSKAHMENGVTSGDAQAKVAIYDEKIKTAKDNIDANRKALKQLDDAVDQVMGRSTSEQGADKAVQIRRSQANDRKRLLAEIQDEQKTISKLSEERAPLASELRKVEAEVGPIKYIAALIYGDNTDANMLEAAVRWVIILLVAVFDPLAIALVLAGNQSKEWDNEEPEVEPEVEPEPTIDYEPDDGPLTEVQVEQVKDSVMKFVDQGEHPKDYDEKIIEEPIIEEQLPEPDPVQSPEPEKSIFELHPYLTLGFSHFENLEPMVAKLDVTEKVVKPKKKRIPKLKASTPVIDPTVEPTVDVEVTADNSMKITTPLPYTELPDDYVAFNGGHMKKDALKSLRPDLFMLNVDHGKEVNSDFGTKFPEVSARGDLFTRVDILPNKVFKYDGRNWIEFNKESSSAYLFNTKYVEYLIGAIDKGQYDPELLTDEERSQIEDYIKTQKINHND